LDNRQEERPFPTELISALRSANHIAVLTGSGISAESGVPTFRDAQTGLWSKYDPQSLATPEAFDKNPRLVWDWYLFRRRLIEQAAPNDGHIALARLEALVSRFDLITQNVDGLHQLAGSTGVIELHGNIRRSRCAAEGIIQEIESRSDRLPTCPRCGGLLRPDVVWFGEALPHDNLELAMDSTRRCDIFLSIGTSSLVRPAASLAILAKDNGARLVEINIGDTPLTSIADFVLVGLAGAILPRLLITVHKL
jgi:NAD-dependent deacetylase